MHYINRSFAVIALSLFTMSAHPADTNTYNRVTFQITEQQQVNNDEISVTMAIERDNQDATELADEVNQLMKSALATVHKFPTISSDSSDYSIRPIYSRDKHLDHWRGSSTVLLKSNNMKDMSALVQKLQETMTIKSTRYGVSTARNEEIESEMLQSAMKKFHARADLITKGLGFKKYRLVNININNSGNIPRPVYAMASAKLNSSEIAAPSFEAGKSTLNIIISGTIEMEVSP